MEDKTKIKKTKAQPKRAKTMAVDVPSDPALMPPPKPKRIRKKPVRFECTICVKKFRSVPELEIHYTTDFHKEMVEFWGLPDPGLKPQSEATNFLNWSSKTIEPSQNNSEQLQPAQEINNENNGQSSIQSSWPETAFTQPNSHQQFSPRGLQRDFHATISALHTEIQPHLGQTSEAFHGRNHHYVPPSFFQHVYQTSMGLPFPTNYQSFYQSSYSQAVSFNQSQFTSFLNAPQPPFFWPAQTYPQLLHHNPSFPANFANSYQSSIDRPLGTYPSSAFMSHEAQSISDHQQALTNENEEEISQFSVISDETMQDQGEKSSPHNESSSTLDLTIDVVGLSPLTSPVLQTQPASISISSSERSLVIDEAALTSPISTEPEVSPQEKLQNVSSVSVSPVLQEQMASISISSSERSLIIDETALTSPVPTESEVSPLKIIFQDVNSISNVTQVATTQTVVTVTFPDITQQVQRLPPIVPPPLDSLALTPSQQVQQLNRPKIIIYPHELDAIKRRRPPTLTSLEQPHQPNSLKTTAHPKVGQVRKRKRSELDAPTLPTLEQAPQQITQINLIKTDEFSAKKIKRSDLDLPLLSEKPPKTQPLQQLQPHHPNPVQTSTHPQPLQQLQPHHPNPVQISTHPQELAVLKKKTVKKIYPPNKEIYCTICDKTFYQQCYYTQHVQTYHWGDKPFKCQRCGKRFATELAHDEHAARHDSEKSHKCDQCPKSFVHKTDMIRHKLTHNAQLPFPCTKCNKGFTRKDHLTNHMLVHTRRALKVENLMKKERKK